jgi:high-affinity nickel permease
MLGLDDKIAALSAGDAFLIVIAVAVLLGLRHATDPDHLTAVSTLVASGEERGPGRAAKLGLAWGFGHATTLFVFGLPIVLANSYLPHAVQEAAEVAVGVMIIVLAARLLMKWKRGQFHAHTHEHPPDTRHRHLHKRKSHEHSHRTRSPLQAYGIGLIHGMGGSAGVGILLLAAIRDRALGVAALFVFALFTAISMSIASASLGYTLSRGPVLRRFVSVAPVMGALSLAFGAWYALGAVGAVPYAF